MFWWKIGGSLFGILIMFVGLIGYRILSAVNTTAEGNRRVSVLTQLGHLVANRDAQLRGEAQDRVNVLLLGIGGAGHEGPLLTDTIILASVKPSTGEVALLSIPRDLAVEIPGYGIRKINNANAFGKEMNYPGGGEQLAADVVSRVTGQPIHYFGRIDFAGFEKIINDLGGITVTVARSFTDSEYPTKNFGYQTIRFTAGTQKMDGASALAYVRSRHGNNSEGSDFARSRRQQLVLEAVRDKTFSLGTILNPVKIGNVLSSLGTHSRTNLEVWEMLRLGRTIRDGTNATVITRVLDSSPNGLLKNATGIDGAFLLVPKDSTFNTIKAFARDLFIQSQYATEAAHIVIRDATGRVGVDKTFAGELETLGYPIPTVETTKGQRVEQTTALYDYSGGKRFTVLGLERLLGLTSISSTPPLLDPSQLTNEPLSNQNGNANTAVKLPERPTGADILIVLGKDFIRLQSAKRSNLTS